MTNEKHTLQAKQTHSKCRNNMYLNGPERFKVPDANLSWATRYPQYKPVLYTAPSVTAGPVWADPDIVANKKIKLKFNKIDGKVNRKSFIGEYKVVNGLPQNPVGRTGIAGRGLLGKWGPNHAADPVVSRWKRDNKGAVVKSRVSGKPILQFVAIKRNDTGEWAIPGGMVDAGDTVSQTLKKEFGEEALNTLKMDPKALKDANKKLKKLFKGGHVLYKGYVDDPRNTDNAWMETVAVNYHDDKNLFQMFKLQAGDDAGSVIWVDVDSQLHLYASHSYFISGTAKLHHSHW